MSTSELTKQQKIIIDHLIQEGSKLSMSTLTEVAQSIERLNVQTHEAFRKTLEKRDNLWQVAMHEKGLKRNRIDNIRGRFNSLMGYKGFNKRIREKKIPSPPKDRIIKEGAMPPKPVNHE